MTLILLSLVLLLLLVESEILIRQRRKLAVLRVKLKTAMHKSAETGNFLNIFSRNIRSAKESADWLKITAHYVQDLIEAESVCIYSVVKDQLVPSGMTGTYPKSLSHVMDLNELPEDNTQGREGPSRGERYIIDAAMRRMPRLLDDSRAMLGFASGEHTLRINSVMITPLISDGKTLGVMVAINNRHPGQYAFNRDQFGRFKYVATQVVLAQNILHVYSELSEQQRISQELEFARNLQKSMLPTKFPVWGKFSVNATSRASKEVSGDFYDFVEIDDDRLMIVIGDACGKGIPACMVMAMTRSFIRANISRFTTLKAFLMELNDNLYRDTSGEQYITLGVCLLNRKESTVEYARAGHTELIMYVRNHIRTIDPQGAGLGLLPSEFTDFDTLCIEFTPNMELLLFTDGINEAVNGQGEQFGIERIKEMFRKSCLEHDLPHDSIARLMGAVDDFSQHPNLDDDQTVVIINHL